jgi:F-box and WD-40 domain protein CDC4
VWSIESGECVHVLEGHTSKIYEVAVKNDILITGSLDTTVKLWSLSTGEALTTLNGHGSLVALLNTTRNDILVSGSADGTLATWDLRTREFRNRISAHKTAVTCMCSDQDRIVSGSDGSLKLWDIRTGRLVRELVTNIDVIWRVGFTRDILVVAYQQNGLTTFAVMDFSCE